ncbi:MAG: MipA/OmpV family protein [Thiohalocapsa sp.]
MSAGSDKPRRRCLPAAIRIHANIAALLGALLVSASAVAGSTDSDETDGLPLWELGIGTALYQQPNYPGSDVRSTTAFPFPYVIYRGQWLRIDRSLQGILLETRRLKIDLSASGTSLVDSDESDARRGMPDLDRAIQFGPGVSLLLTKPELTYNVWGRLAVRTAYSIDTDNWSLTQQGWLADLRLRAQQPLRAERLRASAELAVRFADASYADYYYGVAPQYATPIRPAYEADGGYAGARLGLGLDGRWNRWRWSIYGAYENLVGTAFEQSPLLEATHDFSAGATVSWVFWRSKRRVVPRNTSPGDEFETPLFGP